MSPFKAIMPPYGSISLTGRKNTMGDAITMAPGLLSSNKISLFAVYHSTDDGGNLASFWSTRFHILLHRRLICESSSTGEEGGMDWAKIMRASFEDMHLHSNTGEVITVAGVVVVLTEKKLIVSVTCHSMAVLCRGGKAVPLINDREIDRVYKKQRNGYDQNSQMVEVLIKDRDEEDEFLIIGSGGLWGAVSGEEACKATARFLLKFPMGGWAADAAAMLAEIALAKNSLENITVIVVELKKH
ncbi:probable protein phosphatase 2C 8 [Impatiens glandulifera]|uniref:probable protein phosphatase 2C 8 n=1 Tax=Impatiens glandulifera TaxID=253017 RepID=UPI001FB074D1|nr:probable protein phosphatase 2C 8 [Impatiens glandulifera]